MGLRADFSLQTTYPRVPVVGRGWATGAGVRLTNVP